MNYVVLVAASMFAVEVFLFLPIMSPVIVLADLGRKIPHVILSPRISDHWKEKVLLKYAHLLALNALKIFFWMLVALGLIGLFALAIDFALGNDKSTIALASTIQGIIVATVVSVTYFFLRQKIVRS